MTPLTRAAGVAVAALLATSLLAGCGSDDPEPTSGDRADDPAGTPAATGTAPSESADGESSDPTEPSGPSSEPTDATSEPVADTEVVPVYFTGDSPLGQRLYREFHPASEGDPLTGAAAMLTSGDAIDPDYGTLLDGVSVTSVKQEDGAIVVTLGEESLTQAGKGLSPDDAAIAVQSLVYTVQGAAGTRDPVRVQLANGDPVDLFGQPTGDGMTAAKQLDVLALVNLDLPEEGSVVRGDTLTLQGRASSFEATVPFYVTDSSGKEVLRDFTTAGGWIDRLYPWKAELDISSLAPGDYVLHAQTDDPTGGTEGPGPFEDTRGFTRE